MLHIIPRNLPCLGVGVLEFTLLGHLGLAVPVQYHPDGAEHDDGGEHRQDGPLLHYGGYERPDYGTDNGGDLKE